jgi:hypothetical protein
LPAVGRAGGGARRRRPKAHRLLDDRHDARERRLRVRLEHLGRPRRDDADAVGRALPQVGVGRAARVEEDGEHLRVLWFEEGRGQVSVYGGCWWSENQGRGEEVTSA